MKQYFSALFQVEMIIEGDQLPKYILRDRQGNICVIGVIEDVEMFFGESYNQFVSSRKKSENAD